MADEGLRYDCMVENALRGVVRDVLRYVAERGLPGSHHFYITFRTDHPDVLVPEHLRARFPHEMTIILQYQFWGLEVSQEAFGVTLSFSDVSERLTVPFASVTAFADPSVRFGLQFDSGTLAEADEGESAVGGTGLATVQPDESEGSEQGKSDEPAEETHGKAEETHGKIVSLNTFRKKPGG
jgi:hypothetical protein